MKNIIIIEYFFVLFQITCIDIYCFTNGRNIDNVTTLLNLCNSLHVSPNTLFGELLEFKEETLDSTLLRQFKDMTKDNRTVIKDIIVHLDKNY